jgi:hypothetical protein
MGDEMRKDVKELLISEASKNQAIDNIREDVHEIKETVHEHDKRLQQIDVILAKIK